VIGELRKVPFSNLLTAYGSMSGKDSFWIGQDLKLYFTAQPNSLATGQIQFFNKESAMPSPWPSFSAGFDLNASGTIEPNPVTNYRVLPTRITLNTDRMDGAGTLVMDLLLTETGS
jgi:hypothetical protein